MQKIEFFGAAGGEVTGSCYHLVSADNSEALVDFGMFQGSEKLERLNYELLQFHPASLRAVFLTHAHLDHSGRLPLLIYGGYFGKIYMTAPTRELVEIILKDSARIAMKDIVREPLYTTDEVEKLLKLIETVNYDEEINTGSFSAVFRDAGHILGSASIEIIDNSDVQKRKIVFSGDLGNSPQDIVKPTQFIENADYAVIESTYGDSEHPLEDAKEIIKEEINRIEENSGVLLIPVFAIERTQEILHMIHHLKEEGKVKAETQVFLDSPMGINATLPYMHFKEYQSEEINSHTNIPFNFAGLVITDDAKDSRDIVNKENPKVIIAGSGMMSGGRIIHHAVNYLPLPNTSLLFVGYQADNTLGKKILEGAHNVTVDKMQIQVKARIREIKILSSHADQPRLVKWLKHIKKVKKVFITHGETKQREVLAEKLKNEIGIQDILLPDNNSSYSLE